MPSMSITLKTCDWLIRTLHSFLKVIPSTSNAIAGFTSHFTLTNMKGVFSHQVSLAVQSMQPIIIELNSIDESHLLEAAEPTPKNNGTDPALQDPSTTDANELDRSELRKRVGAVVGAIDPHDVPYGEQTGKMRYAPMPKRAGTTIAKKSATPQYPPFPFTIATTYLPSATIDWTDTAYATWTAHSIENTVSLTLLGFAGLGTKIIIFRLLLLQSRQLTRGWK